MFIKILTEKKKSILLLCKAFGGVNPLSTELFGDFYAYGTDLIFCYMD